MTKRTSLTATCAALLATIILEAGIVSAQEPALPPTSPLLPQIEEGPEITVTYEGGGSVKAKTVSRASEQIGLCANQQVDVSVQYGVARTGQMVAIIPLDGGIIVGSGMKRAVGPDGILRFRFKAGGQPGTYQVSLYDGAKEIGIRFWVFDEKDAQKNPIALAGE